jgi:hypothetical protein
VFTQTKEEAERVFEIITAKDPFRLIIRGHALIEEVIDVEREVDRGCRVGYIFLLCHFAGPVRIARCLSPNGAARSLNRMVGAAGDRPPPALVANDRRCY